jgi:hypothetical protein
MPIAGLKSICSSRRHTGSRAFSFFLATFLSVSFALAHPGSGIVVDSEGQVFFADTGAGVWKIDLHGELARVPGPALHWMTIDHAGKFNQKLLSSVPRGGVSVAGTNPTLILSGDFPVTIGSDGAFYFPEAGRDERVRIMRLTDSGKSDVFAPLPASTETDPDGKPVKAQWIHGLAAGPDRSLYYTEQRNVRRIAPDGTVALVAGDITVPGCVRPPVAKEERLGPALRGLAVASDGIIYVAASACSAILKIAKDGNVSVVLRSSDAWSPTGVAIFREDLFVLEYLHIETTRREDWLPRVRKIARDGTVTVLATINQR